MAAEAAAGVPAVPALVPVTAVLVPVQEADAELDIKNSILS